MLLKCALFTLLFSLPLASCTEEPTDEINKSIDTLLEDLWFIIPYDYSNGIPFAGFTSSFSVKWFHNFFRATVKLETSTGRLHGIDSLRRFGDVKYSVSSTNRTLNVRFQASDLVADFDKVTISSRLGKVTGTGDVKVRNIVGGVRGTVLRPGGSCKVILEDIWVDDVVGVEVNLSGFFIFDLMISEINKVLVELFEKEVKSRVRIYSMEKVSKYLDENDICPFIEYI